MERLREVADRQPVPGQERLGLAVRYDLANYYLRVSYDRRWNDFAPDTLRFSAGIRF